jgi:hypothetical protein
MNKTIASELDVDLAQLNNFHFGPGPAQVCGGYTDEHTVNKEFTTEHQANNELVDRPHPEGFVDEGSLECSSIMITGDQMTTARVRSLKELRVRDKLESRMGFADTGSGWLYTEMAVANGIQRCHSEKPDGLDPGSLNRFITVLGRTGNSLPDVSLFGIILIRS